MQNEGRRKPSAASIKIGGHQLDPVTAYKKM
jgi:hypothetical protein